LPWALVPSPDLPLEVSLDEELVAVASGQDTSTSSPTTSRIREALPASLESVEKPKLTGHNNEGAGMRVSKARKRK
jgi:hypothetical protein